MRLSRTPQADGASVGTADDPPVPFGALSQDVLAQLGGRARRESRVSPLVAPPVPLSSLSSFQLFSPREAVGSRPMVDHGARYCARREGYLVKYAVGPGGIQMAEGRPVSADLAIEGPAARRGDADTLNKARRRRGAACGVCALGGAGSR